MKTNNSEIIRSLQNFVQQEEQYSLAYNKMFDACINTILTLGRECPQCLNLENYETCVIIESEYKVNKIIINDEYIEVLLNNYNDYSIDLEDIDLSSVINVVSSVIEHYRDIHNMKPITYSDMLRTSNCELMPI